ncbi:glycyl-radical enzyme activating protein [Faecalicatena orotica]|uniref:glycyl-radical enzyme activating protein n=1 Tax=Faecalicatena orotica TaxID=1544 RepID=UPI003216A80A
MSKICISNIQKFCVYDGPGIRTVVFFMGCPLRCKWCQNPENFYHDPVVMFDELKCTGCGICIERCRNHAISRGTSGGILLDRRLCTSCGECVLHCRQQAREVCGKIMSLEEVYEEVMKDEVFFRNTGGGITLSGGECTLFPEYVSVLLSKVKMRGIHTAVETCGFCELEALEEIEPYVDLFLYDIKLITPDLHKKWTGQDNDKIRANLEHLLGNGREVVIRIPLVAGVNDGDEFREILDYLKGLREIRNIHILPFHQLGSSKYRLSGQDYEMEEWGECPVKIVDQCALMAENEGFKVNVGGWNL